MSKFSPPFFFANPTNKNCNWNCIYVGTTNSKPLGPIIMIDQSEILSCSQVQFITLFFFGGAQLCCTFHQPRQAARIWCRKTNFLAHFNFFTIIFTVWSHILSTSGDALNAIISCHLQQGLWLWNASHQYPQCQGHRAISTNKWYLADCRVSLCTWLV